MAIYNNHLSIVEQEHQLNKLYSELDSTFNFRCNLNLKKDFISLCTENQTTATTELKRFMYNAVRTGRI